MIKNPSYSGKVRIDEEKNTGRASPKGNPYSVGNVNQEQGPRTGNNPKMEKRSAFVEAKQERAPLATVIEDAYAKRQHEYEDFEYTNGGSINDNTKAEFHKRAGTRATAGKRFNK